MKRFEHALRFRNKRGFGVHSPYMFHLILNVIREKNHDSASLPAVCRRGREGRRLDKYCRLVGRLVVFLKPNQVAYFGLDGGGLKPYLPDGQGWTENDVQRLRNAEFVCFGRGAEVAFQDVRVDLSLSEGTCRRCVVLTDIHRGGFNTALWVEWRVLATVSVDMWHYGLLLFDSKLQKGRYTLTI